ncbi:hypothetical protein EV182_004017 [Spiromyces aspiralis]|uniref:Uncharacterized protein n=1 Tax=Spiromyces aspiralis TaxID=68401 RepID=A0ACC1HPI2_9FUNG|nr:hypothetical protein EV182_004017 [Spiromyces aspiralis]
MYVCEHYISYIGFTKNVQDTTHEVQATGNEDIHTFILLLSTATIIRLDALDSRINGRQHVPLEVGEVKGLGGDD